MTTRDIIFCPNCDFIIDSFPTFRVLGWYRITYSICPHCGYYGIMKIGKVFFEGDVGLFIPRKERP